MECGEREDVNDAIAGVKLGVLRVRLSRAKLHMRNKERG